LVSVVTPTKTLAPRPLMEGSKALANARSEEIMSLFFVGVDVVHHPQDKRSPKDRQAAIERFFRDLKARQALSQLWLVRFNKTAAELLQALRAHFGARDGAVVTEVKGSVAHWWTVETISDFVQGP
jgi:hypothetical protein